MNAKTIKYILLFLIGLAFAAPVFSIFSWYSEALSTFWWERGLQKSYPVVVFVTHTLTMLMVILLLFTPGKQNVSPLHYFANELAEKIYLYMNFNDKSIDSKWFEEKNWILTSVLIDTVVAIVMTTTYFFILKKVNHPDISYLYMIFYLFFIYIIVSVNSYFTTLIERSELLMVEWSKQQDWLTYIQKKNIYTITLIIVTIFILTGGEVLSKSWSEYMKWQDFPIVRWFTTDINNWK